MVIRKMHQKVIVAQSTLRTDVVIPDKLNCTCKQVRDGEAYSENTRMWVRGGEACSKALYRMHHILERVDLCCSSRNV